MVWAIWNNRNEVVWKQKGKKHIDIVSSAIRVLNNWESAEDQSFDISIGCMTQKHGDMCWKQPTIRTVKVNTDAALFNESNLYSFAMVVRDHERKLLIAKSSCKQGTLNPEVAKAVGIREALSWIKNNAWPASELESDYLRAIQVIRCSSVNLSYFDRIIDECKNLLTELESKNVTLSFVKRSANMVAHYLTRYYFFS